MTVRDFGEVIWFIIQSVFWNKIWGNTTYLFIAYSNQIRSSRFVSKNLIDFSLVVNQSGYMKAFSGIKQKIIMYQSVPSPVRN